MDRVAVFVDAGYLYAGGAKSVSGTDGTKRQDISLNVPLAIPYLIQHAEAISQQKLLRIYWYDAAPSGHLTTDHQILASTDNVKLRLGVINGFGQQKGVDGKIITDMTELSRNRAFADAVLLGGDEDLRLGVELAQGYGAKVHLLTIEGSTYSPTLRQESDTMTILTRESLQALISVRVAPTAAGDIAIPDLSAEPPTSQRANQEGLLAFPCITIPKLAAVAEVQESSGSAVDSDSTMQAEVAAYLMLFRLRPKNHSLRPSERAPGFLPSTMASYLPVPGMHWVGL